MPVQTVLPEFVVRWFAATGLTFIHPISLVIRDLPKGSFLCVVTDSIRDSLEYFAVAVLPDGGSERLSRLRLYRTKQGTWRVDDRRGNLAVYTDPAYRRLGLAEQLWRAAQSALGYIERSSDETPQGESFFNKGADAEAVVGPLDFSTTSSSTQRGTGMGFRAHSYVRAELEYIASASAMELYNQHYSNIPLDAFVKILRADPTTNNGKQWDAESLGSIVMGKFCKKFLQWLKQNSLMVRAEVYVATMDSEVPLAFIADKFLKLQKYLPLKSRDINTYKTPEAFVAAVAQAEHDATKSFNQEKASKESEVFYENEDWLIVIPKSHFASVFFADYPEGREGSGSGSWCTTWESSNYFNQYNNNGTLYECMFKADKEQSWQLYLPDSDAPSAFADAMIADYRDRWVTGNAVLGKMPKVLIDIFKKQGLDLSAPGVLEVHSPEDDEEHEDEEHEDETMSTFYIGVDYTERNSGTVVLDITGSESLYAREWDRDDREYGEWENVDGGEYASAEFELSRFDFYESDAGMVDCPEINFTAPGLVIISQSDMGVDDVRDILSRSDGWNGNSDCDEDWMMVTVKAMVKAMQFPTDNYEAPPQHNQFALSFMVLLSQGGLSESDDFSAVCENVLRGYSSDVPEAERANGSRSAQIQTEIYEDFVYEGETYTAIFFFVPAAGDLTTALQNTEFRAFVEYNTNELSTWSKQRERDKQLDLEFAEARKKVAMERRAQISAAFKANLNKRKEYL